MYPCFETIQIKNGKPLHVRFHNERFWFTCKNYFQIDTNLDLASLINPLMKDCRCKIIYDINSFNVLYYPLVQKRKFEHFCIVKTPKEYPYKTVQRDWLDALRKGFDDAILIKDNLLLDTTIANIALKIDGKWFTPKKPLLKGTTRQRLLKKGMIVPADLCVEDLKNAQKFAIMNALLGFLELDLKKLHLEGI